MNPRRNKEGRIDRLFSQLTAERRQKGYLQHTASETSIFRYKPGFGASRGF